MATETGRRTTEEIEITPKMIEAGMLELSGFNSNFAPYSEGVERILIAALEAAGFEVSGEGDFNIFSRVLTGVQKQQLGPADAEGYVARSGGLSADHGLLGKRLDFLNDSGVGKIDWHGPMGENVTDILQGVEHRLCLWAKQAGSAA